MSVCTLPIKLVHRKRATGRVYEPVRYAYCLLDLAADDAAQPTRVFQADYFGYRHPISNSVAWQLTCRTNGEGYLVPVQPGPRTNPFLEQVAGQRAVQAIQRRIDGEQALQMRPGMRFNLYWTYYLDQYLLARDQERRLLRHEYLLHRCSTYFDQRQRGQVRAFLLTAASYQDLHEGHGGDGDWRTYADQRFFRNPVGSPRYRRTMFHFSTDGLDLRPEDEDLRRALSIAWKIRSALAEPDEDRDATRCLTLLENMINVVHHYEQRVAAGPQGGRDYTEQYINNIQGDALRNERGSYASYTGMRNDIIHALRAIHRYVERCGEKLEPLLPNALLQACSHYEPRVARRYVKSLMHAMGIASARHFHEDFLKEPSHFSTRTQAMLQGDEPNDMLGSFLKAYKDVSDYGIFDARSFVDETTKWLNALIPRLAAEHPNRAAGALNRLNQFLHNIGHLDRASGSAPTVVQHVQGNHVGFSVSGRGGTFAFDVTLMLREAGQLLERADHILKAINFLSAMQELSRDRSFRNYLSAYSSSAEASSAVLACSTRLRQLLGFSDAAAGRLTSNLGCGVIGIVISGIDALDHVSEGNNVGALGNTVQAMAGVLPLLIGASGPACIFVAIVALAGALIEHWALSDDEQFIVEFRRHEARCRRADEYRFLDYANTYFRGLDHYLRQRQESY